MLKIQVETACQMISEFNMHSIKNKVKGKYKLFCLIRWDNRNNTGNLFLQ